MNKRKRRRHRAQKRALAVCIAHRPFFDDAPGGGNHVAKLEGAVGIQSACIVDLERCRNQQLASTDRCERARVTLTDGYRHVSTVSTVLADEGVPMFDTARPGNDEALIARIEAVLTGVPAHAEAFANVGVGPALLDTLSRELTAFRQGRTAFTLARKQFTEAVEGLQQALEDGADAIVILEGILTTSPDAPVGALSALQQAKLIGPREVDEEDPAATDPAPAPAPVVPPVPGKAA